jgi:hypothetical protein
MAKKKITLETVAKSIDDLAAMTARGFQEVREEFFGETTLIRAEVKKLGTEMHEEFDEVHKRLGYHHEELSNLGHRVKALEIHTRIHREDK